AAARGAASRAARAAAQKRRCAPPAAFFFQAEDGIRCFHVTGVQTCALPIFDSSFKNSLFHSIALLNNSLLLIQPSNQFLLKGKKIGRASCRERVQQSADGASSREQAS